MNSSEDRGHEDQPADDKQDLDDFVRQLAGGNYKYEFAIRSKIWSYTFYLGSLSLLRNCTGGRRN